GDDDAPLSKDELLAALEKERLAQDDQLREMNDRLLRVHAEMDNVRKRTEREKSDTAKYAISKFALDVLGIGDNLKRAMDAAGPSDAMGDDVKGLFEGLKLTEQELLKTVEKHGVIRIEAMGQIFDPHMHQAMLEQPNPDVPSGTIVQVFQEGFKIGDRVLRPAMVVVARGGAKPAKPDASAGNNAKANGGAGSQSSDADPAPITPDDDPRG
ncbi:MAG: nucleotide exchange factor GrpE, partial [Pseudomonadota bacterium]